MDITHSGLATPRGTSLSMVPISQMATLSLGLLSGPRVWCADRCYHCCSQATFPESSGREENSSPVELLPMGKGPCGVLAGPRLLCHTPKLHADHLHDHPEAKNNELTQGPSLLRKSRRGTPPTSHPGGPGSSLQLNSPGLAASRPGSSASLSASSSRSGQVPRAALARTQTPETPCSWGIFSA